MTPQCSGMVSGHGGGRGLLHACVDASGTAEGGKRGRGPSAFLGEIPIPPSSSPVGADVLPQAHRSPPPRTPDARSCEAWAGEKAGGVPAEVRARGRFAGSRIGRSRNGGLRGAAAGKVLPEKTRMAPCRASIRLPFPTPPGKPGSPRPGRRAGHGVTHGEPATASRRAWRPTESAMNPVFFAPGSVAPAAAIAARVSYPSTETHAGSRGDEIRAPARGTMDDRRDRRRRGAVGGTGGSDGAQSQLPCGVRVSQDPGARAQEPPQHLVPLSRHRRRPLEAAGGTPSRRPRPRRP
jgi:hypothetical protein